MGYDESGCIVTVNQCRSIAYAFTTDELKFRAGKSLLIHSHHNSIPTRSNMAHSNLGCVMFLIRSLSNSDSWSQRSESKIYWSDHFKSITKQNLFSTNVMRISGANSER